MIHRCHDETHPAYQWYGARGVRVCDRWRSFDQFHADMGDRPAGMSLDRINVDGNYEASNCRWATAKQQQRNRRNNRLISHAGETKPMSEWAETFGIKNATLWARLKRGMPFDVAVSGPASAEWSAARMRQYQVRRPNNRRLTHDGEELTMTEWAARKGLKPATLWNRLNLGWSVSEAINGRH